MGRALTRCECGAYKDSRAERCRPCAYAARRYHLWSRETCVEALQAWAELHGRTPTAHVDWCKAGYGHPSYRTVARTFGSWNAGVEAAGLRRNRAGGKLYWTKDRIAAAMLDFLFREGRWPTIREWDAPMRPSEPRRPDAKLVIRRFGKWTTAKRYAGWAPEKEGRVGKSFEDWCCAGCGIDDPESRTRGCLPCKWRSQKRRNRGLATAPSATDGRPVAREAAPVKPSARRNGEEATARTDPRRLAA